MSPKIRVAFWHNSFTPYRVPLFQRLAAFEEIALTVYYGSEREQHRQWTPDFGQGYRYQVLPALSIPWYPHTFNPTLWGELLRQRYDVHIACENELGGQLTFWAARRLNKPFILWSTQINYQIIRDARDYTVHGCLRKVGPFIGRHVQSLIFAPFSSGARYVKKHADAYIAAGQKTAEHLRSLGAHGPIFQQGNTIDTAAFRRQLDQQDVAALKRRMGLEGQTVILTVAYLQERKGIHYLIEAFLQCNWPDSVLLIVGSGPYQPELLNMVPEGRSDIRFIGHDEQTAPYYALADIFVMPSFSDPWGLTINEAMIAGLPVITTTNVGAQELIRGNGMLIPPRDSVALQTALERLLADPHLRQEMGQRSREIIQPYTIEHAAHVCRQAILTVVSPNRP